MSQTTTVQVKRRVKDELERLRVELDFASLSEVIEYLLADRKHDSDLDQLRTDVEAMKKQIAYLLQQVGGAGEDDQTRE